MSETPSPAGNAMLDLCLEVLNAGFKLRAAGKKTDAVTAWGGGTWGLLRGLVLNGPMTVPEIARARPVARQHIQKLVNELAADGLVEMIDNPAHKRSRLVTITRKGRAHYNAVSRRIGQMTEELAAGIPVSELRQAERVVAQISGRLAKLI
jgi:DNA-binding MarR family transcriptional regulator